MVDLPASSSSCHFLPQLSIVREDSREESLRTKIDSFNEVDQQSDKSDFDIIESLIDHDELNEGI